MKKTITILMLAFLAAPGCLTMNPFAAPPPPPKEATKPPAPPPVLADEITPENAKQKAVALDKELDYDGMNVTPAAPTTPAKP